MCWGKKEGESDTSRTPKGSAGSIWSLRNCLDGCSAGLDGLGAGIGSTHPEVGHDDTGNDNESSFHDHSGEESQKQAPAPLGQRSCPWRVGRDSVSTPESAVHLRSWHAPGMQPRLLAAFFDVRRERPHGTCAEPSGLAPKHLHGRGAHAPPMDSQVRLSSSDCFPVSGSPPAVAGDRYDSECLGVPVAPPPVTGWRRHY